ncbi:hypothetical protein BX666DRAFT_1991035 [Dichotomocladium elegans]|nr:hypothetical protein BX666DRAFT_1991035 [Dichotomocladium elegans]
MKMSRPSLPSTPPPSTTGGGASYSVNGGGIGGTALKRTGSSFLREQTTAKTIIQQDDAAMRNLGLDYHDIQKRSLTLWVNSQLAKVAEPPIAKIETDLKDGKKLLKLLSVVSGQNAPKPERMNMRIHQLSNVAQALNFLERQQGIDVMPDIGNEAIVNGDVKKTLALIFFIMLRYQIGAILADHGSDDYITSLSELSQRRNEDDRLPLMTPANAAHVQPPTSIPGRRNTITADNAMPPNNKGHGSNDAKIALLYWVRTQLEDYIAADMIPSIQDFSRSWRNGLAFCLLLHRHDTTLIPDLLTERYNINMDLSEKSAWHNLLVLAFDTAYKYLHIPRYLDPEDLIDVEYPYEPTIMMYISEYYKVMSHAQREESPATRRENTAKRRAAIAHAMGHDVVEKDGGENERICESPPAMEEDTEMSPVLVGQPMKTSEAGPTAAVQPADPRTPLEAPQPVQIPSSTRRRKPRRPAMMHQRESTLGEEEKARIKADLNSRLMMQLTGHLPRGVHPLLDQLLTIHETAISFIKTNTRTLDEIPEEFTSSSAIAEYLEAIEIIEDQALDEVQYLATAKEARDTLMMLAPVSQKHDDETLIRLTDLQRSQVGKLFDNLTAEWKDFQDTLHSTKADLIRIENDLVANEEAIGDYTRLAALTQSELNEAVMIPILRKYYTHHHPLDGDADAVLDSMTQAVADASARLQHFENTTWRTYRAMLRDLLPAVREAVAGAHSVLQARYDLIDQEELKKAKRHCSLFKRGISFGKLMDSLHDKLTHIRDDITADDAKLLDLETQVSMVKSKLNGIRQEYDDLFSSDNSAYQPRFDQRFEDLQSQCQQVSDSVEQVRFWLIETKRVREWLWSRIRMLEQRQHDLSHPLAAVEFDSSAYSEAILENDHLRRELERFDDVTSIEHQMQQLNSDQNIPAKDDTAKNATRTILQDTIAINHQLVTVVQRHTQLMDLASLRTKWELLIAEATAWLASFRQTCTAKSRPYRPKDTEKWRAQLDEFSQKTFAQTVDVYQMMDKIEPLPEHMELRQSALVESLEDVDRRVTYCCRSAEQEQIATHVINGLNRLQEEAVSVENSDQVQTFKEKVSNFIAEEVSRVPYLCDEAWMDDATAQTNQEENDRIRNTMQSRIDDLQYVMEQLLIERLSLKEQSDVLLRDMESLTVWCDKTFAHVDSDDWESIRNRVNGSEYSRLLERAQAIEEEIDKTNNVYIDRNALINAEEKLAESYQRLLRLLQEHERELVTSNRVDQHLLPIVHDLWSFIECKATFVPSRHYTTSGKCNSDEDEWHFAALRERVVMVDTASTTSSEEEDEGYSEMLDKKHKDLSGLLDYAAATLVQRGSIVDWLDAAAQVKEQGKKLLDLEDPHTADHHALMRLKRTVQALIDNTNMPPVLQVPDIGGYWEDFDLHTHHERTQREMDTFLAAQRAELKKLLAELDKAYNVHQNADKIKQLVELYQTEIDELRHWIGDHMAALEQQPLIDPLSIDVVTAVESLHEQQAKHQKCVAEMEIFEQQNIHSLQDNIAQLLNGEDHQQDGLQHRLDQVLLDLDELKHAMEAQTAMFDAAQKRVNWETMCLATAAKVKDITKEASQQLYQTDKTVTKADIDSWQSWLATLEQEKDSFVNEELVQIDQAYHELSDALVRCQRSKSSIPAHMESRMDSLYRMKRRLCSVLAKRFTELGEARKQMVWVTAVDDALDAVAQHETDVNNFVTSHARWSPDAKEDQDQQILEEYKRLNKRFYGDYEEIIGSLLDDKREEHDNEIVRDKREALKDAVDRLKTHLNMAEATVTQHRMVNEFMRKINELDAEASEIREYMLGDRHSEVPRRLGIFRTHVADVLEKTAEIPYPARQQAQIQDETINEVIRDAVTTRSAYIQKLATNLEQQLESKEIMTRCQVQLSLYKQHAEACELWIAERCEMLNKYDDDLIAAGKSAPLCMDKLQHAVSTLAGMERAMDKTKDNIYAVLESLFDQCVAAFDETPAVVEDEEQHDDVLSREFDMIATTQERISDSWRRLREDVPRFLHTLSVVLEPTDQYYRVSELFKQLSILQTNIDEADYVLLRDETIQQWQKRVDILDASLARDFPQRPLADEQQQPEARMIKVALEAVKAQLDAASDMVVSIRAALSSLYDKVNLNRLRNTYVENSAIVTNTVMRVQDAFKETYANFDTVTAENRLCLRQQLVAAHKDAQRRWNDCKDVYDDLQGYYDFIKASSAENEGNGVVDIDAIDAIQSQVQEEWAELQLHQDRLLGLLRRVDRWIERYDTVDNLMHSLRTIERDMGGRCRVYSSSTTSSSFRSRTSSSHSATSNSEGNLLTAIEKRLNATTRELEGLLEDVRSSNEDMINRTAFLEHVGSTISTKLHSLHSTLVQRRMDLEKANLLGAYSDQLKRYVALCDEQVTHIKQQAVSSPSIAEKKPSAIQNMIQTYVTLLKEARSVHARCRESLERGTLSEQATMLVTTYHVLRSETDGLKQPLEKLLADLENRAIIEEAYMQVLESVCNHAQVELDTMGLLNEFKETVARFSRSARIARTKGALLPDLSEFERRQKAIEQHIQDFFALGNEIKAGLRMSLRGVGAAARVTAVTRAIDRRQDTVRREWSRTRGSAEETHAKLKDTQMRQHALAKLAETARFVSDLKHRMIQLEGKSMAEEHLEFKAIQDAMSDGLARRLQDADMLVAGLTDKDGKLKRQRWELSEAVDELGKLVQARKEQAELEGNLSLFLGLVDKMHARIAQLNELADETPKAGKNNRVNKSDIQLLLRKLTHAIKDAEAQMAEWIETARAEARKQFMEHVASQLDGALAAWAAVKEKVGMRDKELQGMIEQLDQEFFTKLSLGKSTPPGGRPGSQGSRLTPTPPPPVASSPRRASVNSRAAAMRRTPTPTTAHSQRTSTTAPVAAKYVADPKNELDVHLGKIVNDSQYRMKIKRVAGEAGKYWFGDEFPRLVYCRILPSKVVMVRVGGGWLELTKFLKNHESTQHARGASNNNKQKKDDLPPSNMIRGFAEGDKYIRVDEEGKQRTIKMAKAKEGARTTVPAATKGASRLQHERTMKEYQP